MRKLALAALLPAVCLALGAGPARAAAPTVTADDPDGAMGRAGAPACAAVTLDAKRRASAAANRLYLRERRSGKDVGPLLPAQLEPDDGTGTGRLWWRMPPGPPGRRVFALAEGRPAPPVMRARLDPATGQVLVEEAGRPVLRYNINTIEPGALLERVSEANRIYARARSDYIHPLYGPDAEEMTKDWPLDHPHHRGIYWAWPEVDWRGQRGDLHALQRVFARPSGRPALASGPVFAQIVAVNEWKWDDKDTVARERAVLRVYRGGPHGRVMDLTFRFTAAADPVLLARRGTNAYGGLNIRLNAVAGQQIAFHTDPPGASPRMAWADLSGTFAGGTGPAGLAVFQNRVNPDYPGDWVQFPELNWFQPTFPASGTRCEIRPDRPLTLRYRLWVRRGGAAPEAAFADQWRAFDRLNTSAQRSHP